MNAAPRRGIACAGNWIVDHVKIIDVWPNPGNLANILAEEPGTGGAPFNVLVDIARMVPGFPLEPVGLVGGDADGEWIRDRIRPLSLRLDGLRSHPSEPTSYTDVMTVQSTGHRTFFHMRGANAAFDVEDVDPGALSGRIFHLGYLLLLTALDRPDPDYGTRAARLLAKTREAGLLTSIDVVSAEAGRFAEVVVPALRFTDYCVVNEVEAEGITGIKVRSASGTPDWPAIESAAAKLVEMGVSRAAAIHLPEGAVALAAGAAKPVFAPSFKLPEGFVKGTAGAGDAFCAGVLYGLHEGWTMERTLRLGHAAAAMSLRHPTCTGGMGTLEEALALAEDLERRAGGAS